MQALEIIANSWPIALMVVGLAAAIVFRRCFKQVVDHKIQRDEWSQTNSRVVSTRRSDEG